MNEMLLLGAGASKEAGVPLAVEMTARIADEVEKEDTLRQVTPVIRYVMGGLLFRQGRRGLNPLQGADVEELFNAVSLLKDRDELEVSPFISSWDPMILELERASPSYGYSGYLVSKLWSSIYSGIKKNDTFNSDFASALNEYSSGGSRGSPYFEAALEQMTRALKHIVRVTDATKVGYLDPILNIFKQQQHVTIATLNYDNTIELLCESYKCECETGIKSWSQTGNFEWGSSLIRLLKLHGSVNWFKEKNEPTIVGAMPQVTIGLANEQQIEQRLFMPAVIFGQRNKLTAEGPYLDLLRAFRSELFSSDVLTVIGYSFRDRHINEYISQWLNSKPANKLRLVTPRLSKLRTGNPYVEHLQRLGEERFKVIEAYTGAALQTLYGSL